MRAVVTVGAAIQDANNKQQYWAQTLQPMQNRFQELVSNADFPRSYHQEEVRVQIVDILESSIGKFHETHFLKESVNVSRIRHKCTNNNKSRTFQYVEKRQLYLRRCRSRIYVPHDGVDISVHLPDTQRASAPVIAVSQLPATRPADTRTLLRVLERPALLLGRDRKRTHIRGLPTNAADVRPMQHESTDGRHDHRGGLLPGYPSTHAAFNEFIEQGHLRF